MSSFPLALERRQPKRITAILKPKHTQQEAIHKEQHGRPRQSRNLLRSLILNPRHLERKRNRRKREDPINRRNDLRLQAKLILEPAREVRDAAVAVARHVWHFADVVEHVARREEQDGDERDSGPDVAVLDHGHDVWVGDGAEGYDA